MALRVTFRGRGLALLGGLLLLLAGANAIYVRRVLDRTTRAEGRVYLVSRRSVLVQVAGDRGLVPVAKPFWSWPGRYRRGQTIGVRYDPRSMYLLTLFAAKARRDDWADNWLTPTLLAGIGAFLVLAGVAAPPGPGGVSWTRGAR